MHDQYVSVDEAANELDVSRATAWKWIKRHGLQTYRFMGERRTFVQRADLARLQEPIPVDFEKKQAAGYAAAC